MAQHIGLHAAFLALPLEGEAKQRFCEIQQRLEPFASFLFFQNPASPHLTLRFWRELFPIEVQQIEHQAEQIARKTQRFSLRINGADTFGRAVREVVLFLTVAFSPELADLKKRCPWPNPPERPSSGRAGPPDQQEFHPHITLARIRHPQRFTVHRKRIMKALDGIDFSASLDRLRLYAEVEGRKQTPLQDFVFASSIA